MSINKRQINQSFMPSIPNGEPPYNRRIRCCVQSTSELPIELFPDKSWTEQLNPIVCADVYVVVTPQRVALVKGEDPDPAEVEWLRLLI